MTCVISYMITSGRGNKYLLGMLRYAPVASQCYHAVGLPVTFNVGQIAEVLTNLLQA